MRLRQFKEQIDELLPKLDALLIRSREGKDLFNLGFIHEVEMILRPILHTRILLKTLSPLLHYFDFAEITGNAKYDDQMVMAFQHELSSAFNSLEAIGETLASVYEAPPENTIQIRIPEVADFNDLAKISQTFQKIFTLTIIDEEIGGNVKIETVENGSIWFDVVVFSSQAVAVIGAVSYAAHQILKMMHSHLTLTENRRTKKIANDSLEELQKAQTVILTNYIEAEADQIEAKFYQSPDPTRIERLKEAIRLLSGEFEKGALLLPPINATNEIKDSFPDPANLLSFLPKLKELNSPKKDEKPPK